MIYKSNKEYSEALNCFNNALNSDDNFSDSWTNKGLVLKENNEIIESKKCFEKAISINPLDSKARIHLTEIIRGDYE